MSRPHSDLCVACLRWVLNEKVLSLIVRVVWAVTLPHMRPVFGQTMERRLHVDWLLCGSIALLAFSVLGFAYRLWQVYITIAK
jgi:hypothetical protein